MHHRVRTDDPVSRALVALYVVTVDRERAAIGEAAQRRTVNAANISIGAGLLQKHALAVQTAITALRAMALHGFAHLRVETKNVLEIMLHRPLADGIQVDFHFVQGAPVIQQVLLFPEQQAGHSG